MPRFNSKLRQAFKSKTIWFAIIVAVLSVLQGFIFAIPVAPIHQAVIGVVLAVIVTVLRFITTGSINDK